MKKPKIITLCGSSQFTDVMAVCAWLLEREEKAITMGLHLLPGWYSAEEITANKYDGSLVIISGEWFLTS